MREPAWGVVVGLGAVVAAFIVVAEPASVHQRPKLAPLITQGMGRADDPLDQAWALRTGQVAEVQLDALPYRMERLDDGSIRATEVLPDGRDGRVGVLLQQGRVAFD